MKCWDIATKDVKACHPECSAKDAAQIMKEINSGIVPVVDKSSEIQGIITDRDIILNVVAAGKDPEMAPVKEFMSKPVITVHPDDDIDVAVKKMRDNKIRRIPVINNDNKLVGIISLGDIAVTPPEGKEACEAFEAISTPVSSAK